MKQIISFKKELPFKTKVSDITSISLEREVKVEEDIVTGVFHIAGDYKMNEGSINRDNFSFDLPFDITLDSRYDTSTVKADIEDFYYDLVNNDTLKVNIDLFIEAEYQTEQVKEEDSENVEVENVLDIKPFDEDNKKSEMLEEERAIDAIKDEEIMEDMDDDLFSNLDNSETYSTYYVYMVKEEDNIDKILNKYGLSKEELEEYNDITDVKVGDKLIIPKCNEK